MNGIGDFTVRAADGTPVAMAAYAGRVLLVVNTASKCGFTPQYDGLEALHRRYAAQGLTVQEPGDAAEIANFCSLTYDVTFPVMAKVEVNGEGADPLFGWLKREAPGLLGTKAIKWNFTKFLVDRSGKVVGRYAPTTKPEDLARDIEGLL